MTFKTMQKLITNANIKLQNNEWSVEEYEAYKEAQQNKIDIFYAKGRLTDSQYETLTDMWLVPNEEEE